MRKPYGFWKSPDNIVAEARKAMQEHGWDALPGAKVLQLQGHAILVTSATTYHGGLNALRILLGEPAKKPRSLRREKGAGYWQNESNFLREVRQILKAEGWEKLPTQAKLAERGYSNIIGACRHYGGLAEARILLGESNVRKRGQWKDLQFAIAQAKKFIKENKLQRLPSEASMRKLGNNSLVIAITRYHGGMHDFRKILGDMPRTKVGSWKNPAYFFSEIEKYFAEFPNYKTLPSRNQMVTDGYGGLACACFDYYGGLRNARKSIAEHSNQPSEQEQLEVLVGGYDA